MPTNRKAFTLVELLVVIAIIGILASMLLIGARALFGDAKKKKSDAIIAAVNQGLELFGANKGGSITPAEHPFAGSRRDFYKFVRATGGSVPSITSIGVTKGVTIGQLSNTPGGLVVFQPDDVFSDQAVPLLYGLKREYIGILGASNFIPTTRYYKLAPAPGGVLDFTTVLPSAITPSDAEVNLYDPPYVPPYDNKADHKKLLDYVFGNSIALAELARLKAVYETVGLNDKKYPKGILTNKVKLAIVPTAWSDKSQSDDTGKSRFEPGLVNLPGNVTWKNYKLPGLAIYDAWNQEILCSISATGRIRLRSAGKDGAFVVDPYQSKTIDTTITNSTLTLGGDDRDGTRDNIQNQGDD